MIQEMPHELTPIELSPAEVDGTIAEMEQQFGEDVDELDAMMAAKPELRESIKMGGAGKEPIRGTDNMKLVPYAG